MEMREETTWKESFFKDNFNVDQYLSKYTLKSDLETLRSDLKNYGNELHQQMADILKTETEAIVNLAEYLTNLNSKIDNLSLPISQLREEIKTLYTLIKGVEENYLRALQNVKSNNKRRNYLILKSGIISSAMYIDQMIKTNENDLFDDSIILERVVNKYSFEYNYLEAFCLSSDVEEIHFVGRKLTDMVNKIFLKSVQNCDKNIILRCLRMYDNLSQQSEAERLYQIHIIRPALKPLFTENHLENCNQEVNKIYEEALNFVDTQLSPIIVILKMSGELKSFNFILNSFWVEVDKQLREGLPHITAPGNPELFQKRFKNTWNFLSKIAEKCGDPRLIQTNPSFQNHIKRFNLPVYFEIRFQQIAGQFESEAIMKPGLNIYQTSDIGCYLKITSALWKAFLRTFNSEVFIDNLGDQFLKLSMLLLARYLKWFENAVQEREMFSGSAEAWENFVIKSINDLNIIKNLIGAKSDVQQTVYSIMPAIMRPVLVNVLELNEKTISVVIRKLQDHLIYIKSGESLTQLQHVASIPRLYRRTNRVAPKTPSNYMVEAVSPILNFHNQFKANQLEFLMDTIIANITRQYSSLVEEVLRSVCKTEESLRRLKNRNTQISEASFEDASDTMTDEMKIREQIKLDVCYFIDNLYPLSLEEGRKSMDALKNQTC